MLVVNTRNGLFGQTGRGGGVFSSEQRGFGAADYGMADRDRHLSDGVVNVRGGVFGPGGHGGGVFDYATAFGAIGPGVIDKKALTKAVFAAQAKDKEPDLAVAASIAGNAVAKSRGNDKGAEYTKIVRKALDKGRSALVALQDPKYYTELTQKLTALANTSDPMMGAFLDSMTLQDDYNGWVVNKNLGQLIKVYGFPVAKGVSVKDSEFTRDPTTWGRTKMNGVFMPTGGIIRLPPPKISVPYEDWKKSWGKFEGKKIPDSSPIWDYISGLERDEQSAFFKKYKQPGEEEAARKALVGLPTWFRSYYSIAQAEAAQLIAERAAAVAVKIPAEGRNWWPWIIAAGVATVGVGVLVSREKKVGAV